MTQSSSIKNAFFPSVFLSKGENTMISLGDLHASLPSSLHLSVSQCSCKCFMGVCAYMYRVYGHVIRGYSRTSGTLLHHSLPWSLETGSLYELLLCYRPASSVYTTMPSSFDGYTRNLNSGLPVW